ncbi:MAG: hypothetical protein LH632_22785 [Rhodoferax sp.]|nr:hypothetical protein [Rhodoferax sp.]
MDSEGAVPGVLQTGRFAGREAFSQLLREAFAAAAQRGWREIVVSDSNFEDWPLQERAVAESLGAWAKPGRRFVMVAAGYDAVLRNQARFVVWRRTWSHLIDCRQSRHIDAINFPSAMHVPGWAMQRLDLVRSTGVCTELPERRLQIRETLDELLRGSSPGFAASVLGL